MEWICDLMIVVSHCRGDWGGRSSLRLQVVKWLGVPAREAYKIMVGAAQAVGFRTDVKLNRIAEELRRSLQLGCKM